MTEHIFGGDWTEIKLEVLRKYLSFYTTAFKNQPFTSIYIDAFAGSGERQQKIASAPLLNEEETIETLAGSARIALSIDNPFGKYIFIETNKKRRKRLSYVIREYPELNCYILENDANLEIKTICDSLDWKKYRAVLFLDPYGLEVDWKTLIAINNTKAIDIWYLFSISGIYRQAAIHYHQIENYKKERLNRMLGTTEWQEIFYDNKKPGTTDDMFYDANLKNERTASVKDLEEYVKDRLLSIFPYVSTPLPLFTKNKAQLYSLFLCVSNPSPKATALAKKVCSFILKQY